MSEDGADNSDRKNDGFDSDNENSKIKWQTLEHHGMTFPPAYQRLPDGVRLKNKKTGEVIELDQEIEEYATWFAPMEGSEFGDNP